MPKAPKGVKVSVRSYRNGPILDATEVVVHVAVVVPAGDVKPHFCCGEHNSLWCRKMPKRIFLFRQINV